MADFLSNLFGSKTDVARYRSPGPLSGEQTKSLLGNIANEGDITQLGDFFTKYFTDQQNALLPGYSDVLAKGEKSASGLLDVGDKLLTGEIPQDVKDQIQRSDAYTAFSGGYGGSGMSHGLTARDLGLTSLDLMKQGASFIGQGGNSAQQWAGLAGQDILNPASMFVTPQQTAAYDTGQAELQQQSQQNVFNAAAQPDPRYVGVYNKINSDAGMAMGAASSAGGAGL